MLRWLYLGRMAVAAAIFIAAVSVTVQSFAGPGLQVDQVDTLLAGIALISALLVTAGSWWWTSILKRTPSHNFLYTQVLYDVLLVTLVIHVTGGANSHFAPLYILVIAAAALLLPLPGGMLIGAVASLTYFIDLMFLQSTPPSTFNIVLLVGLMVLMAIVTAALGDRLRRAGVLLGTVESELRQLRLDLNEMVSAIDTGLITVDGAGRLMHCNDAAARLLALQGGEWTNRPVLEELDRTAPGLGTLVRRTSATRVPVRRFEIRQPGVESDKFLGVRTTVLDREGMPWVTAVMQDITEGKQIEDLIRRAERLQAVAELGASLAHEIKNPLASIRSAVEQIAVDRVDAKDREVLRRLVVVESERLTRLLAEFMEFSRVEMRRWTVVDLRRVATDAIDLANSHPDRPPEARILLNAGTDPIEVDGDPDLLHRAVFNLLLNALQHSGNEGRVRVDIERASAHEMPSSVPLERPIRLSIRDNGPGIPDDEIPRLFDPFHSTRTGGTGLGLALVHRAVEAHRGTIFVDGAHGGASFTVYLPARTGNGEEKDARSAV
jgi:two-component system sensor histidine kinase PilS (NtrC family)